MIRRLRERSATATLLRPFEPVTGRALYVGLSGGIGAGKTSVADVWAQLGAHVFSADELSREVVATNSEGLRQIREHFGPAVIQTDGTLNRAALGRIVFKDEAARKTLERITHPLIAHRAKERVNQAPAGSVAVYDVPLLVETQMANLFDVIAMVNAPLNARLTRLEKRGLGQCDAEQRIAAQATVKERKAISNIWLQNDGSAEDLERLSSAIYERWLLPAALEGDPAG